MVGWGHWLLAVVLALPRTLPWAQVEASGCKRSEFLCNNNRCLSWDRFCDGVDHCGDASDEPRHCSRCNRTYYGETERTYLLELHRPRDDRLPFVCRITFQAAGNEFGDIVQVTFEGFAVGRMSPGPPPSCPDGYVHIAEVDRPDAGGIWCGSAWGRSVYFSEGNGVTLTLHVLHLPPVQTGYNFEYRLAYKFLNHRDALVRYGRPDRPYFRGTLLPGTYCSLIFDNCRHRWCRLQSPNFPGLYPRNTTCYYAIRQHLVPTGLHALIRVSQAQAHLIYIKNHGDTAATTVAPSGRGSVASGAATSSSTTATGSPLLSTIKVGDKCPDGKDHVTIYDGYTVRDPVLLRFCGSGVIPPVTSSRNEILVEFVSSSVDTFPPPTPTHLVSGFQLDVEVELVDEERASLSSPPSSSGVGSSPPVSTSPGVTTVTSAATTTSQSASTCEFLVSSKQGGRRGVLLNPPQSLPKNASCRYTLRGLPQQVIWLAPLKFHVWSAVEGLAEEEKCAAQVEVWDGREASNSSSSASKLLTKICRDGPPRSCDHALLDGLPRSCQLPSESFISSGSDMVITLRTRESTALRPLSFRFLYEFVELRQQDGVEVPPQKNVSCFRLYRSQGKAVDGGNFQSPTNVFLFGRGGRVNLTCVFRFEALPAERVKLALTVIRLGEQPCVNEWDPHLSRHRCTPTEAQLVSRLRVWELPWNDTRVPRECFCNSSAAPLSFASTAPVVELTWDLLGMTPADDGSTFRVEGAYEFLPSPPCRRNQRMSGSSGELRLRRPSRSPEEVHCESQPWLVLPRPARYIYLSARGYPITPGGSTSRSCPTRNRVAVYSGGPETELLSVFCPDPRAPSYVEVFSLGWKVAVEKMGRRGFPPLHRPDLRERAVIVDFVAKEPGAYTIRWLELARDWSVVGTDWDSLREAEGQVGEAIEQQEMRAWWLHRHRKEYPPTTLEAPEMPSDDEWEPPARCSHRCPELEACISSSLWCDGRSHCPSAYDESHEQCSTFFFLRYPMPYVYTGAAAVLLLLAVAAVVAAWMGHKQKMRRRSKASPLVGTSSSSSSSVSAGVLARGGRRGGRGVRRSATDEEFLGSPEVYC